VAARFFTSKRPGSSSTVLSEQARKRSSEFRNRASSFGEGVFMALNCGIATTTTMEESVITSITKEAMMLPSVPNEIFRAVHGVSPDKEQPNERT